MIPIFCINLERATERKAYIEENWIKKFDLPITFWKAYDRRDIEKGRFIFPYDESKALQTIYRQMSDGEIACATSFAMLYQYLIQNKIPEAIIMEDDVIPLISHKNDLFDAIKIGKNEFPNAQVILLHKPSPKDMRESRDKIYYEKKQYFSLCEQTPWGNLLFYITLDAVKKYFKMFRIISNVADGPQRILCKEQKVIIVNNPLCSHIGWDQTLYSSYIGAQYRASKPNRKFIP